MKKGHRLSTIPEIPGDVASELAKYSIARAEEFLAQVETGEPELRSALNVAPGDFDDAVSVAQQSAGPEYDAALKQIREAPDYSLGALSPTSDEFNGFLRGQETGEVP